MSEYEVRLKDLRYRLLDSRDGVKSATARDCAAHMLLYLDRPGEVQRVALRHLLSRLAAQRTDIGLGSPEDLAYSVTTIELEDNEEARPEIPHTVPNRHPAVQIVWRSKRSVSLDARHDPILGSLRADLLRRGIRSKLACRLSDGDRIFGMVCVDYFEDRGDWSRDDRLYLDMFVTDVLSPILNESLQLGLESPLRSLTSAEVSVARLVAKGMSYKEVGRELGKSPSTVDNQLCSIRAKLGVGNRVELLRACSAWL